jgi:hypothetical protein
MREAWALVEDTAAAVRPDPDHGRDALRHIAVADASERCGR